MSLERWVDVSVYSKLGPITVQEFADFKNLGYSGVVVGSWHGNSINMFCYRDLRNALQAGLKVATYIAIVPGKPIEYQIQAAYNICNAEAPFLWDQLRFVTVDVEIEGISVEEVQTALTGRPS